MAEAKDQPTRPESDNVQQMMDDEVRMRFFTDKDGNAPDYGLGEDTAFMSRQDKGLFVLVCVLVSVLVLCTVALSVVSSALGDPMFTGEKCVDGSNCVTLARE